MRIRYSVMACTIAAAISLPAWAAGEGGANAGAGAQVGVGGAGANVGANVGVGAGAQGSTHGGAPSANSRAVENANGQFSTDRELGRERADERKNRSRASSERRAKPATRAAPEVEGAASSSSNVSGRATTGTN